MAVLHITYKHSPQISKRAMMVSISNNKLPIREVVSIALDDQHRGVTANCLAEIQTIHLPRWLLPYAALDPSEFSAKDRTLLSWLAGGTISEG